MNYRVDWADLAEQQLAALWLAVPVRGSVTAAAARLDFLLRLAPLRLSEPIDSSVHRVTYIDPIGAEFEVIEDDKVVIVHAVFATS